MLGADKDYQDIQVRIGNEPPVQYVISVSRIGDGSVISSDGLINCGADCSQSFNTGSEVELVPQAAPGVEFVGWGCHPDCAEQTLEVMGNLHCVSVFE